MSLLRFLSLLVIGCSGSDGGGAPGSDVAPDDAADAAGDASAGAVSDTAAPPDGGTAPACELVATGSGPTGQVPIQVDVVAGGLEVPWGLAFLPGGDLLVTERPGRVRLLRDGQVLPPVAQLQVAAAGEAGLLGLALHPDFAQNRWFYLYLTATGAGGMVNRVERWHLAADSASASLDQVVLDGIPAAAVHDGGRLRFGPDAMLYVGTGDAANPQRSRDLASLGGKILRLGPDGAIPADNPTPGSAVFVRVIRNTQGFDRLDATTLAISDHGPSGELGRSGHDEVNLAAAGADLGWPTIFGCETQAGLVTPLLTWVQALPPGGAAFYTGQAIPEWQGSLLVAALGARHLQRVVFAADRKSVTLHEVYLQGEPPAGHGRLREVLMAPDGHLYVTTSNCDGRGACPADKDKVLRIRK